MKTVVHKAKGNYGVCGRFLRDWFLRTLCDDEVTCKVCAAGGMGPFKLNYKTMSVHNHDEEIIKNMRRTQNTDAQKPSETDKSKWDTILTDAIVLTDGSIQPYDRILKYLSDHYEIKRK